MEKKNTILLTVIAVATLLVAVVGATFAYFATTVNQNQGLNVNAITQSASAVFLAQGDDIEVNILANQMLKSQASQTNTAVLAGNLAENNATLSVIFGSSAEDQAMFCTYDLVFFWSDGSASKYLYDTTTINDGITPNAPTTPTAGWYDYGKEFTISLTGSIDDLSTGDSEADFDGTEISTTTNPTISGETNIAYDGTCLNSTYTNHEACEDNGSKWLRGTCTNPTSLPEGEDTCTGEGLFWDGEVCHAINATGCTTASGEWTANGDYMTLVKGAKIVATKQHADESIGTIVNWDINVKFYNLPLNQNQLSGTTFSGRVEVANIEC